MSTTVLNRITRHTVLLAITLCAVSPQGNAQTAAVDTSDWVCKYCLFDTETLSTFELGAGRVSSGSFKFGQANGLGDKGSYFASGFDSWYFGENGAYWDLEGNSLGSDLIQFDASGGIQGRFGVTVAYQKLPVLFQDTALTPYSNLADNVLTLADGWVRAENTAGLTTLPLVTSFSDIRHERTRAEIGAYYLFNRDWELSVRFRQDDKSGATLTGGAIGGSLLAGFPFRTQAAMLREPIDQMTHTMDAALSYSNRRSNVSLGFMTSVFEEDAGPLVWNNAFLPLTAISADNGLLSLAPDNRFFRFHLAGGHRFDSRTRLSGRVSYSRATQDAAFLPATISRDLQVDLPRGSLDGRVNTFHGSVRVSAQPLPRFSVTANLSYRDRDNQSTRGTYDYVITDAAVSGMPRLNLPYSFSKEAFDVSGTYRFDAPARVSFGYDFERVQRTLQDSRANNENTLWSKLNLSPHHIVDIDLKLAYADRSGSIVNLVSDIQPAQSPLMRKYNTAPRTRKLATGAVTLTPGDRYSIGLSAQVTDDDYSDSVLGLERSREHGYTLDVSVTPAQKISLAAFASVEKLKSTQVQSENLTTPTWAATTEDSFTTIGSTLKFGTTEDRVTFDLEFLRSESEGETLFRSVGTPIVPLPDLDTTLTSLRANVDIRVTPKLQVRLSYIREDYDSLDWALDNVDIDSIPNVLWTGERSFLYDVNVPSVSFRYQF